jgi:heme exporter protein A
MLQVIGLSAVRNERSLFSKVTFDLLAGTALQIQAPNGFGKTTFLKMLAQIYPAPPASIHYAGERLFLGHKTNLHPALSVRVNLEFLHALSAKADSKTDYIAALDFAGLKRQQDQACEELSAGQCQRVNLARLYLSSAKLWLLDEPFTNLDLAGKKLLIDLCKQHLAASGMIIFATHSEHELVDLNTNKLYLENYA